MSQKVVDRIRAAMPESVTASSTTSGDENVWVRRTDWKSAARFLRQDPACAFDMFVDLTCVDYPRREERFEVWLRLYSIKHGHRICLRTFAPEEDPKVETVSDVWKGANWFEREAFDLLGVVFDGHPDLRRILMYPEFEGHPLRKDYPADRTQPLVPYRQVPSSKLPPFGPDMGMPWSRQVGGRRSRDTL